MMRAQRVLAQGQWELRSIFRNGEQVLVSFGLPLLTLIALFTVGLDGLPRGNDAVAGVLAMAVMSSSFTSQAIALAFDRRYGVLRMFSTTPLGAGGLLLGKAGAVVVLLVLQLVVLLGSALLIGWGGTSLAGLTLASLFMLLGAGAFVSIAVLFGGTMRAQAVIALANLLWVLMTFAGGALFPLADGSWLAWLPPGALGDGMRAALAGSFDWVAALILAAWTVVVGLLAARSMKWD